MPAVATYAPGVAETTRGVRLALLLLGAFDALVDDVVEELERKGHPGVTAGLEFALAAVAEGADSASALGRRLGTTRQAAAKTVATLERMGYVERVDDPADARLRRLRVTARGAEMTAIGAARFDQLRDRWVRSLDPGAVELLEESLARLVGDREPPVRTP